MAIDWTGLQNSPTRAKFFETLKREIARQEYLDLSDIITARGEGGEPVLEYIHKQEVRNAPLGKGRMWKLRVIRDEWGNEPPNVKEVTIKRMRPLRDPSGLKITGRKLNDHKRRGTFERTFVDVHTYEVDEYGCITCPFEDAVLLLRGYGVHHASGEPITGRREMSSAPCKAPDGSQLHVWYWRYVEVPPDKAGELKPLSGEAAKRGRTRGTTNEEK